MPGLLFREPGKLLIHLRKCISILELPVRGLDDPDMAKVYCENSAPNIEWLISLGMEFKNLFISGSENYPEYSAITPAKPRGHYAVSGGAFFRVLKNACDKRGIKALYKTRLKELITDPEGEVCGVIAEGEEKAYILKPEKPSFWLVVVMVTTREMLKQYSFDKGYKAKYTGSVNNTGDGIRAGQMLGADLVCMGQIAAIPAVQRPGKR